MELLHNPDNSIEASKKGINTSTLRYVHYPTINLTTNLLSVDYITVFREKK